MLIVRRRGGIANQTPASATLLIANFDVNAVAVCQFDRFEKQMSAVVRRSRLELQSMAGRQPTFTERLRNRVRCVGLGDNRR